ncbi:CHAD domain-containing protein [Microbulbifer sp. SA54]|uniref:CHAD domain-containing protein n=1 Tax=Microbulbifer sp. SA54 TaxID=3401577 RepID=UPI003AAC8EDF
MTYRFRRNKPLQAALKRIASEQVSLALRCASQLQPGEATHQIRKHCKKMRALARLIRTGNPACEQIYLLENAHYRKIADVLSDSRDAVSLYDALTRQLGAERFPVTAALLNACIDTSNTAQALEQARQLLLQGKGRIELWNLGPLTKKDLLNGYAQSYRRAYKAAQAALAGDDEERFHALRKRVKDQWYHSRLLKKLKPRRIGGRCKSLNRLASDLGDWRDLRRLRTFLVLTDEGLDGELIPLLDQADLRLQQLRENIERECAYLFARKKWHHQRNHRIPAPSKKNI